MFSQASFEAVCQLFHRISGIKLGQEKRALVASRLQSLASAAGFATIDEYVSQLINGQDAALQLQVVDRLTTNETYFFREAEHFKVLAQQAAKHRPGAGPFRVWSAASSSGEEGYSIAMVLADKLGPQGWEVVGTDLSSAMVEAAVRGVYPLERTRDVPRSYLSRFCRKGQGDYEGQVLIARELRPNVRFGQANLMQPLPDVGMFDVIFLRNVLIYFDAPSKAAIVNRVLEQLKPDGLLFTGHSESMTQSGLPIVSLQSAVYAHA